MAAWLYAAVTDTTPLNPRCSALAFRPFTARGKNNRTSLCASKQDFFFNLHTAVIWNIPFPSFPLHFLDPAIHPLEHHVHPVACCRCFCPVLTLTYPLPLPNTPTTTSAKHHLLPQELNAGNHCPTSIRLLTTPNPQP